MKNSSPAQILQQCSQLILSGLVLSPDRRWRLLSEGPTLLQPVSEVVKKASKLGMFSPQPMMAIHHQLQAEQSLAQESQQLRQVIFMRLWLGLVMITIIRLIFGAYLAPIRIVWVVASLATSIVILLLAAGALLSRLPQSWFLTEQMKLTSRGENWTKRLFGQGAPSRLHVMSGVAMNQWELQDQIWDARLANESRRRRLQKLVNELPLWEFGGMGLAMLITLLPYGFAILKTTS